MIKSTRRAILAACVASVATGCTTSWWPMYDLNSVRLPDGTQAWRVQCPVSVRDTNACFEYAKKVCKKRGYRMIESGKDPREIAFACNERTQVAAPASPPPVPAPPPVARKMYTLDSEVLFPFGKSALADLNRAGRQALDGIAQEIIAVEATSLSVDVRGHTDRIGSETANLALSEARAQTVAHYLSRRGVPENRISTVGIGAAEPVSSGCPAGNSAAAVACLAPDRRVTIEVRHLAAAD